LDNSTAVNVAIIGVGNMGRHHARIYHEMPRVDLVAVCDENIEKAESLAKQFDCRAFGDYRKMVAALRIDAASVVVPTYLHHTVACDMFDLGVHVLLEKPIASNLREAREIIDKAHQAGQKLMVGHIERFNPAVQRLRELIASNRLGEIISINIKRVGGLPPQLKNANVLLDLALHDVDICNFLLGEFPLEVQGHKSKNLVDEQEDSAVMLLKYNHASAFIEVNWVTPVKIRTLDITGTRAFARLDYIEQTLTLYENTHINQIDNLYDNFEEFVAKFSLTDEIRVGVKNDEPLRRELESFIASILCGEEPEVSGEDGYRVLEIVLKI
jgi:UDP-N-acetylglucosamine 3-dehydrogenase